MRFGIQVPIFDAPGGPAGIGPALADIARRADAAGLASFWVMDHFFQIEMVGPVEQDMLEGYTALAWAAAATERIRVGTMVTGATYRHPGLLVKTVTTLDVLSGGRAWLGIGAGWFEREHRGLGVPFPSTAERFERLEETLQIAQQMWKDDPAPFHGKHFQLEEPINHPQPLSKPHPPILVGGGGEKKTLRLVAQYADACNLFATDLAAVRHKLKVLRGHCEALGRPYEAIEKTVLGPAVVPIGQASPFGMEPARMVEFLGELADMGIDHYIAFATLSNPGMVDLLGAEVMPHAPADRRPAAA
jgi:F420-dependent oxidoreductase-like protein